MTTYPLSLALEDFVPVIFASLGYFWIVETLTQGHDEARLLGRLGTGLLTLGGLSKATWKLVIALSAGAHDIVLLDKQLFFFLATGFICVASALWAVRRGWRAPLYPTIACALVVVAIAGAMYARDMRAYRGTLIAVMVLTNTTTLVLAIQAASRRASTVAALAIGAYLVTGFIMSALSRLDHSVGLQWMLQSVNTTGALGLLVGARLLKNAPPPPA